MPLTNPRLVMRQYFDVGSGNCQVDHNFLRNERGNEVAFQAHYEMSDERLLHLFRTLHLDLVFIIHHRGVDPIDTASGPIGYDHHVGVQPVVIDQWRDSDAPSVVASNLIDAATQEIRRIFRYLMSGSVRMVEREIRHIDQVGSTLLWGDEVVVRFTQYVSYY